MKVKNDGTSIIRLKHGTINISFPVGESIQPDSEWIVNAINKFKQLSIVIDVEASLDDEGFIEEEVKVVNTKKKTARRKRVKKEITELKEEIEEDLDKLEELEDAVEEILDEAESCDD